MEIQDLLQQTPALPSLPRVVHEVIATLSSDIISPHQVADKLAADQVLSAKVLRLANSSYYAVPRSIYTVADAVALLGFGAVRSLVLSAGLATSYRAIEGVDLPAFWRFALHTAVAGRYLANRRSHDADVAFTVGLLHGLGRLVMEAGMPDRMRGLRTLGPFTSAERSAAERRQFGASYAEVGAELLRRWNFPPRIVEAVRGCAAPNGNAPDAPLHAVVFVASWRAANEGASFDELRTGFPTYAAEIARVDASDVLDSMPPLPELAAGMGELLSS
jgi:HD-like signal output (HDOD) protein